MPPGPSDHHSLPVDPNAAPPADGGPKLEALTIEELIEGGRADLHTLARQLLQQERASHTLQATALLGELWVRLLQQQNLSFESPAAFWAWGARAMRHILIDHARRKRAHKRTPDAPGAHPPPTDTLETVDLLALDDAMDRLDLLHPRSAKVVEMRYFGGLPDAMIAERLGVSDRTVRSDWKMARAWLHRELGPRTPTER